LKVETSASRTKSPFCGGMAGIADGKTLVAGEVKTRIAYKWEKT